MLYTCKICQKEFKKKCHYTNHLNRIFPCVKKPKIIQEITPKYTELTPKAENRCIILFNFINNIMYFF